MGDMRLLDSRYYKKPCAWCCDDDRCGGNNRCEPVNFFTHGNYVWTTGGLGYRSSTLGIRWTTEPDTCERTNHGPWPYTGWSEVPENLYHHPYCWNTYSRNPHNQQATCGTDILWQMRENGKSERQAYCAVKNFPLCKACLEPLCGQTSAPRYDANTHP